MTAPELETAANAIPGDGKDLTPEMPASLNDTSLYVSLFLSWQKSPPRLFGAEVTFYVIRLPFPIRKSPRRIRRRNGCNRSAAFRNLLGESS